MYPILLLINRLSGYTIIFFAFAEIKSKKNSCENNCLNDKLLVWNVFVAIFYYTIYLNFDRFVYDELKWKLNEKIILVFIFSV